MYVFTTLGFSFLHGPHQLAQKSINTILPFNPDKVMVESFASLPVISGALFPKFNPMGTSGWVVIAVTVVSSLALLQFKSVKQNKTSMMLTLLKPVFE